MITLMQHSEIPLTGQIRAAQQTLAKHTLSRGGAREPAWREVALAEHLADLDKALKCQNMKATKDMVANPEKAAQVLRNEAAFRGPQLSGQPGCGPAGSLVNGPVLNSSFKTPRRRPPPPAETPSPGSAKDTLGEGIAEFMGEQRMPPPSSPEVIDASEKTSQRRRRTPKNKTNDDDVKKR